MLDVHSHLLNVKYERSEETKLQAGRPIPATRAVLRSTVEYNGNIQAHDAGLELRKYHHLQAIHITDGPFDDQCRQSHNALKITY